MKIITFFPRNGYGAMLQAFAMRGATSGKVVRIYRPADSYSSAQKRKRYPLLARFVCIYRKFKADWMDYLVFRKYFPEMQRHTLPQTSLRIPSDTYIVGSDQVWNPNFIPYMEDIYFLTFAPPTARRISYAASLGMPCWPKDFEQKVLPELRKFHAISVREESSAEYLRSLGLNAVCVCDPTILHTADFYRKGFYKPRMEKRPNEPFTFIYRLREELSENLTYKSNNRKLVWQDMRKKKRITVAEWLWKIDRADLVVTDSFHAVVFCLLFHTPFEVILNQGAGKGMNERFATLLGKAGLPLAPNPAEIDWESVDARLAKWREYSQNWLKNALGEHDG